MPHSQVGWFPANPLRPGQFRPRGRPRHQLSRSDPRSRHDPPVCAGTLGEVGDHCPAPTERSVRLRSKLRLPDHGCMRYQPLKSTVDCMWAECFVGCQEHAGIRMNLDMKEIPAGVVSRSPPGRLLLQPKLAYALAIAVVAISVFVLMIPIIMTDCAFHSASYNEGFNIQHAMRVTQGRALYDRDVFRIVNYPYISFYLTAFATRLGGEPLIVARTMSFAGFMLTLFGSAASVRAMGGSMAAATMSAVLLAGFYSIWMASWIGVADPQFLALGFSALGLAVHLRARSTGARLILAPLLLVLAIFTKHQEIAIPAAVMVDMAVHWGRQLPAWLGAMGIFSLVFTAAGFLAGDYFLDHLLARRQYDWHHILYFVPRLLEPIQLALAIGIAWLFTNCPSRHRAFLYSLGIVATLAMMFFSGGIGVSRNIAADFLFWLSLAAGLGATAAQRSAALWQRWHW